MKRVLLLGLLLAAPAQAQTVTSTPQSATVQGAAVQATDLTLPDAVAAALQNAAEVRTAQANLDRANAADAAAQADPSVLVAAKLNARNAAALAEAGLRAARLSTLQSTVTAHSALLEAQENVNLQSAQVDNDSRALKIAQTKAELGNATTLDVQNAGNALAASSQTLADARAQVTLAAARLAALTGKGNDVRAVGSAEQTRPSPTLAELQAGLPRLSSLVAAAGDLAGAELAVRLADNDYTPARTLQDARTGLANAQRALTSAQQGAQQTLASAYQSAQNAAELLGIAQSREEAAEKSAQQDAARLQSGTISAAELQTTQLSLKKAQYARLQAQNGVLKALAALSVAAGQNLTGIGEAL